MNKAELISAMAADSGLSKSDCKKALDAFVSNVCETLEAGEKVSLTGFGTFMVTQRKERPGVNLSTKEKIVIPAKNVVKFKPGTDLADAVQ
ncbi:MAG: HU family DNA-binding protein [Bacteroides sp.]|nr:HU family DNA-binding protein [Bacteroides sp.]